MPDIPGCVVAGDTLEETEELMREAIELYIDTLREDGKPVPESRSTAKALAVEA